MTKQSTKKSSQITLKELKKRIDAAAIIMDQENLGRLWTTMEYWASVCRIVNEGHVDALIYCILYI